MKELVLTIKRTKTRYSLTLLIKTIKILEFVNNSYKKLPNLPTEKLKGKNDFIMPSIKKNEINEQKND